MALRAIRVIAVRHPCHLWIGFVYFRNRWYDPNSGRFLTQDPIGLAGGVNLYAYAGNNPISFSDPFGLLQCPPYCSLPGNVQNYSPNPRYGFAGMRDRAGAGWYAGMEKFEQALIVSGQVGLNNTSIGIEGKKGKMTPKGALTTTSLPSASAGIGVRLSDPQPGTIQFSVAASYLIGGQVGFSYSPSTGLDINDVRLLLGFEGKLEFGGELDFPVLQSERPVVEGIVIPAVDATGMK